MLADLTDAGPHAVPAHKRPLLRVAQELKDRLRFRYIALLLVWAVLAQATQCRLSYDILV